MSAPAWVAEVDAARAGDVAAAGALFERFEPLARSTAHRLVGTAADAEDVVQESFVEAFATIDRLRVPEAFPAWLRLIVRKHADRTRRSHRPAVRLDPAQAVRSTEPEPDEVVERAETAASVRRALAGLALSDRRLLELRYLAGWTTAELADLTGSNGGAVRKRLHDARRRIRPALDHLREDPMTNYDSYLGRIHSAGVSIPSATRPDRPAPLVATATGLRVLDAVAPVARGGTIELAGPLGTGQLVLVVELAYRLGRGETEAAVVAVGSDVDRPGAFPSYRGLVEDVDEHDRHAVVLHAGPSDAAAALAAGSNLANGLAASGVDVILAVDRVTLDDAGLDDPATLAGLAAGGGSVTLVVVNAVPREESLPPSLGLDTRLVFSLERLFLGIFPALDPAESRAAFAEPALAGEVRQLLADAARLRAHFHQPLRVAERYTGEPATWIDQTDAENELRALLHH